MALSNEHEVNGVEIWEHTMWLCGIKPDKNGAYPTESQFDVMCEANEDRMITPQIQKHKEIGGIATKLFGKGKSVAETYKILTELDLLG